MDSLNPSASDDIYNCEKTKHKNPTEYFAGHTVYNGCELISGFLNNKVQLTYTLPDDRNVFVPMNYPRSLYMIYDE